MPSCDSTIFLSVCQSVYVWLFAIIFLVKPLPMGLEFIDFSSQLCSSVALAEVVVEPFGKLFYFAMAPLAMQDLRASFLRFPLSELIIY